MIVPTRSSPGVGDYDPWVDINDDGQICGRDISIISRAFGTYGDPINKTALLLDLLGRVEALENQSLPQGYIGAPAYNSGWIELDTGWSVTMLHGLNTTKLFVYLLGRTNITSPPTPRWEYTMGSIGGDFYESNGEYDCFGAWVTFTNKSVSIERGYSDWRWDQVRVMIWKIPEP